MQTSYAFIASYKQRIQALDRGIQNQNKERQQAQRPQQDQRQNVSHVVEHRKLVQRFRQFLADEERFWTQLVVRLRRSFALTEAAPALAVLGILPEGQEAVNQASITETTDGVSTSGARNHFQFPPEDPSMSFVPTTAADKETRLAILTKAIICLGDIARYRELYNESGGRPKAGQEDVPSRRARARRGGQPTADILPRPRNYHRAQQCYEQARLLMPHDGNPSHQLAILAFYQKDSFLSLFHYYRALCVRQPYDTASENLGSVLTRALDQWYHRLRREREKEPPKELPPRVRVEQFKDRIVVLHAVWRLGLKDLGVYVSPLPLWFNLWLNSTL